MNATITFDRQNQQLVAKLDNGQRIAVDWNSPITASSDSHDIARAVFSSDEIQSVDHDGEYIHVALDADLYASREAGSVKTYHMSIDLWLDETSDADEARWVVDLDGRTLASFDDRADAYSYAKDCCQRMGYPVVEIDQHGVRETVYEIDRAVTLEE